MNRTYDKNKPNTNTVPLSTLIILAVLLAVFIISLISLLFYLRVLKLKRKNYPVIRTLIPVIFVSNNGLCLRKPEGHVNFAEVFRKNSKDYAEAEYGFVPCDVGHSRSPVFEEEELYNRNYFRIL